MTAPAPSPAPLRRTRRRRRTSVAGVIGELLITIGVVAFLYVGWQMWLGDIITGAQRSAAGNELSQQWSAAATSTPAPTPSESDDPVEPAPSDVEVPVIAAPADMEIFGLLRIPRFGSDYVWEIGGGTTNRTLNGIGVGHNDDTQTPGQDGNVVLAAHRLTYGGAFNNLDYLQVGDPIVIESPEGWYTYRFRTLDYVYDTQVDVLNPVPQSTAVATEQVITLISCSPRWTMDERIIAYGVFESFTPREQGEPASLTEGADA